MKQAKYSDAFQSMVKNLSPNTGKNTPNSPHPTKGGITISQDLIPDELSVGDEIVLKVADVDTDNNEIHFEYEGLEGSSDDSDSSDDNSEPSDFNPKTL
jgi:hypothetical protein